MEQGQSQHRCINSVCGRAFPRAVNFCPWCGTAQRPQAAVVPPAPVAPVLAKAEAPPVPPPPAPPPQPPVRNVPPPPPARSTPPPARPAPPPRPAAPVRKPVRLRWWLLALGVLWLAWMLTKPLEKRIERRMDNAIALAKECKPRQAQDELIALRKTRATREQLRRVQDALNAAASACTRAERRRDSAPVRSAPRDRPLADPTRNE